MPSTYSPDLRIELMANGANSGTWGVITNTNLGTIIEDAISGLAVVPISGNTALTVQQGAQDQARCSTIKLTNGGVVGNFSVFVPPVTKLFVFENTTSVTATVYASTVAGNTTPAGSGVSLPLGASALLRCDGVNVVEQFNRAPGNFSVTGFVNIGGNLNVAQAAVFNSTTNFIGVAGFSVSPTAPTAAPGTNTTALATTAFVTAAAGAISSLNTANWSLQEFAQTIQTTISIGSPAVITPTTLSPPDAGTAIAFSTTGALPTGMTVNTPYYVFNRTSTNFNLATTAGLTQSVAISIASPAIITTSTVAPENGDVVIFATTGALPTGLVAGTRYFAVNRTITTFQVSATSGGTPIVTTGSQSGIQTITSYTLVNTSGTQSGTQSFQTSKLSFRYKLSPKMTLDLGGNLRLSGDVSAFNSSTSM